MAITGAGPREAAPMAYLPPAESVGLLDFDAVEIQTLRSFPPKHVLVVHGTKPFLNMDVELVPLVFVQQPEYWGVEVIGRLGELGLPAVAPYTVSLSLAGVVGTKGIEVIGATHSRRIDLPGGDEPGSRGVGLVLELQGDGTLVEYAEDAAGGSPRLRVRDAEHDRESSGADVAVLASELGRQATVPLEDAPDAPAVKLTLLLPPVRLDETTEAAVSTFAIVSTNLDAAFTAGPHEGQRIQYRVLALTGTARRGAGGGQAPAGELGCRDLRAGSFRHAQGGLGLRVSASCTVRTGGQRVELRRHEPPGIDPRDLLLDLVVVPADGRSTDALTDVPVLFADRVETLPDTVTILPDGDLLTEGVTLPVHPID